MDISLRLETVAKAVKYRRVADIGTDHGYVPIYLVKKDRADYVIACDANKGPLLMADENIRKNGLNHKIETRLGNGLEPLKENEVEAIVISGMGGKLTVEILKNGSGVLKNTKQLVLSPHIDVFHVRKYLHSIGFMIKNEKMIFEEGKYYTIISAFHGEEHYEKEEEYIFGRININKTCPVLKQYIEHKLKKAEEIKCSLLMSATEKSFLKAEETEKEILKYKEVLKAYEM